MHAHDQRSFSRIPLPFPVRIHAGETVIEVAEGLDVSARGISIATSVRLPIELPVKVEILLADSIRIEAAAVVRRQHEQGLGLELTEIGLESFDLLKNLIKFNSQDPERVEREFCSHLGLRQR